MVLRSGSAVSYVVTSGVPNKIWKKYYLTFALKAIQSLNRKTSKIYGRTAVCKVDFERKNVTILRGRDLGDSGSVFLEIWSIFTASMSLKGCAKKLGQARASLWFGVRCLGLSSETPYACCFARAGVGARAWGISRAPGDFARAGGGCCISCVAYRCCCVATSFTGVRTQRNAPKLDL